MTTPSTEGTVAGRISVRVHHYVYFLTIAFTALSFLSAALSVGDSWPHVFEGLGVATASHVAGFLLALILFIRVDDSLKPMRTAVLGALSGTGLVKAEAFGRFAAGEFTKLPTDGHAGLFFAAIAAGLLGVIGGFAAIRLGLEREIVEEQRKTPATDVSPASDLGEEEGKDAPPDGRHASIPATPLAAANARPQTPGPVPAPKPPLRSSS